MAWDDVLFGVLTGGLYNVGKAAYQAGEAAEDAGNAAEQAGVALAVIGSTVEEVGKQLTSLLKEAEELITIDRLTPRDESDLWEEEKERLDDLKKRRAELEKQLSDLGVTEPGSFSFDFWEFLSDPSKMIKIMQLTSSLVVVKKEIHEILYQEPGVITTAIYNLSESLERFNTIEQPKIEDILDGVEDNLEVSEETLKEVKKLFVTRKLVPVHESALTLIDKDKLKLLEHDKKYYQALIGKKNVISVQLLDAIDKIPVTKFEITDKGVKVAGIKKEIETKNPGKSIGSSIDNPDDIRVSKTLSKNVTGKIISSSDTVKSVTKETIASDLKKDEGTVVRKISTPAISKDAIEAVRGLNLAIARKPNFSRGMLQPQAAKISAVMNTKSDGYNRAYALSRAHTAFYDRQMIKLAKKIDRIKYRFEDQPGVIPKTLEELKQILERVRTQEQPRIETVLDTLNGNLEESKEALSKINDSLDSVQGVFTFINKNAGMIKIGLGIVGAVIFLDILLGFFVLLRMALGL